ncbi:arabinan endo-1,5-alpha-L-arabinosidase [Silvibacterium bohemicum]|uniref:Arabinan endo-1,5-alpha-L-arabinosidase n=1 Tax=Silvibacterium bohemicum TaxID=1577686 RepID=A0A841JVE7_9BACT|nr:arabinan endo-1,5-alpha-L-arabinosidase [Silvibacterium bohemicum]MBB6145363.1 arabinan endo-1,5-alpha-L-arabinosidase [Silvibacterium bohemicum]
MSRILNLLLSLSTSLFLLMPLTQAQSPEALRLSGDVQGTHDPSMIHAGNTWYVFATGKASDGGQFQIRCSNDLHAWKLCGHVFDQIPEWIQKESPGTKELWAPDISYANGEYQIYYAYSLFGKNTSGIALITNKTLDASSPDYKWIDHGLILKSTEQDDYNAIDPNFIADAEGHHWLAFGSFWSGIKMRRLDDQTGKLSSVDTKLYSLASRARPADAAPAPPGLPPDWEAVEAPFVVHHGNYYYLFVSWDLCCRGLKSTYRTMVGRSRRVTGPYVDEQGRAMMDGGGTQLLTENKKWLGPGGESIVMQPNDQDLIVFHAYDATTGKPSMQISTITWDGDWPHAALQN